jgi:GH43 family beta-xylosidase
MRKRKSKSKRLFSILLMVAMIISLLPVQPAQAKVESQYRNPLMKGADPTITRDADGFYYCCFGTDNDIYLKKSETVLGIATAKSRLIWKKPADFGYVWGPYIYRLEGKWYIILHPVRRLTLAMDIQALMYWRMNLRIHLKAPGS